MITVGLSAESFGGAGSRLGSFFFPIFRLRAGFERMKKAG